MEAPENKLSSHLIASRLIDLIIQLPEHEQLSLLKDLEERQKVRKKHIAPVEDENQDDKKIPRYASGDYIFWDLFR